jgi:replicative DNA helicase
VTGLSIEPAPNGHNAAAPIVGYLIERGFSPEAIREAGWRIEQLGAKARRYGLPAEAAETHGWLIPYRHRNGRVRFERLRLIDPHDLERFGGGKYRQPAGVALALYDPYGALELEPLDELLLIEGEANTAAVHVACPSLPVLGLPGQASLKPEMAEAIGHVPLVHVWIDRHDPGASRNAATINRRLRDAGVGEVRFLPDAAGVDANEVLRELGLDGARETFGQLIDRAACLDADEEEDWPSMPRPTLPVFPLDALPEAVAEFVRALAAATETPPDLAAMGAIGVLSVAALGVVVECGGTWDEEMPLYLLVAMESGDRKSSVLGAVARPLHRIESELREDAKPVVRELKLRKERLEARKARLVKQVSNEDDIAERQPLEEELERVAEELEEIGEPVMPRLLADDATPETLGGLLAKYDSLAIVTAEAPIISNVLGRYDSSGAANLDLMCKAYEGERTQVDRRNREELLERPLLTVLLTVQPLVLRRLIEHETARQQGLVARFVFVAPESLLGRRRHDDATVLPSLRQAWEDTVRRVYTRDALTEPTQTGSVGSVSDREIGDFRISLSPSARKLLKLLRQELEARLVEDGDLRPAADWIARHVGRIARIAALLHLAGGRGEVVEDDTVLRAMEIGEYLLAHGLSALAEPDERTRHALRWLERQDERIVTVRDLHRGPLNARGPVDHARELADRLVALGALRPAPPSLGAPRPGQPPSPGYLVHPQLRSRT